jgi:hypothetical protein
MDTIDFLQKKIETNLVGLRDATARSRTVFIFSNISIILMAFALFNAQYSWMTHYNLKERPLPVQATNMRESFDKDAICQHINTCDNPVCKVNHLRYFDAVQNDSLFIDTGFYNNIRKMYVDMYYERQYIKVPLLNVNVSVSDLTILSPIVILIFITWYFYNLRRENHILIAIKYDFDKIIGKITDSDDTNWKILLHHLYSGTIQTFVFNTGSLVASKQNVVSKPIVEILRWHFPWLVVAWACWSDIVTPIGYKSFNPPRDVIIEDSIVIMLFIVILYQIFSARKVVKKTEALLQQMRSVIYEDKYSYKLT